MIRKKAPELTICDAGHGCGRGVSAVHSASPERCAMFSTLLARCLLPGTRAVAGSSCLPGRLFAVCGDGEFVIYTAQAGVSVIRDRKVQSNVFDGALCQALRNKSYGPALEVRSVSEHLQSVKSPYLLAADV